MSEAISLDLDLGKNNLLEMTKENENLVSGVSDAFSKAVNKGIDLVELPEDYKKVVTTEVKKTDWKEAGSKVIEGALRIGAKAIGINSKSFDSLKTAFEALKAGNFKEGLSSVLDSGIEVLSGIPKEAKDLIKSGKDIILGTNLENELKTVMVKQKNTIDRLDKKCDKFDEALKKNDEKEMKKQVRLIKNDLEKVMIIENTISRAKSTVNQYELMQLKGTKLTPQEKEICAKI